MFDSEKRERNLTERIGSGFPAEILSSLNKNVSNRIETRRKVYPKRKTRRKFNYRDLERGMFDEIRKTFFGQNKKNKIKPKETISDGDEFRRFLWCFCQQPWDHLRVMLRCDFCFNWFHHDCVGIEREKALRIKKNEDRFLCSQCQNSDSDFLQSKNQQGEKRKSSEDSTPKKFFKKSTDKKSSKKCLNTNCRQFVTETTNFCSSICIRGYAEQILDQFRRNKKKNNERIGESEDFLVCESRTKRKFQKSFVPNVEDLCQWFEKHKNFEILLCEPTAREYERAKKSSSPSGRNNVDDIRSKVPRALQEKLISRLEKAGTAIIDTDQIEIIADRIEKEMFRVFGKVDNGYKNKFRSLLANISNMNNHFFYQQIVDMKFTAEQIVMMKPEDMLPPEEKEKRKDEFNREVELLIEAQTRAAEDLARRRKNFIENQSALIENLNTEPSQKTIGNEEIKSKTLSKEIEARLDENSPLVSRKISTESNNENLPIFSSNVASDSENDYIDEPESPSDADAFIYDENEPESERNSSDLSKKTIDLTADEESPIVHFQTPIRDDYNPSKVLNENRDKKTSEFVTWNGFVLSSEISFACRSTKIYGENRSMIREVPQRLTIVGRLKSVDLWNYVRDSMVVRDVVLLEIVNSGSTTIDNENFVQYIKTMKNLSRAVVISKPGEGSLIRDIYILPADTENCPISLVSSFSLEKVDSSNSLFLVLIGSKKKSNKVSNSSSNESYRAVSVINSSVLRDPRLLKNTINRTASNSALNEFQIPGDNFTEENMELDNDDNIASETIDEQIFQEKIKKTRRKKSRFSDPIPQSANPNPIQPSKPQPEKISNL